MKKLKSVFGDYALVTGASSGIGEEFARQIAAAGMNLVLIARRVEKLNKLSEELSSTYGVEAMVLEQDLSQEDAASKIVEATKDINIGLLISNAGDGAMGGFLKHKAESFDNAIKLNLLTPVKLIHHFLGKMYSNKKGGLLIVSSGIAVGGAPHIADYSATKAYQLNLGQALHHEVADVGVHVTVLMPGPTKTEAYEREDIDFNKMPMPPMATKRVVITALKALVKNKPVIIPGMMNKFMDVVSRRVMSRSMTSKMFGLLMKGLISPKYQY
ncbi:MAG: SDR family NAD(P)-dependent oxidoreductase [Kangiellaceae bacterium]|nr:SDR family NAD(P)-dependent oxidoreductase [Kangiellaceae bacterium]